MDEVFGDGSYEAPEEFFVTPPGWTLVPNPFGYMAWRDRYRYQLFESDTFYNGCEQLIKRKTRPL